MSATRKQLHLNVFMSLVGHHEAAWRHPATTPDRIRDLEYYQEVAQIAERGKLDSLFWGDDVGGVGAGDNATGRFDPLVLMAGLISATSRIGLIATASTTYNEPFNLARRFASLDHLSKGRAGWNIVTSWNGDAPMNFGLDALPDHAFRYARAHEFMEVVLQLWDSWEDDAVLNDRANGRYLDLDKIHRINHIGEVFKVRGPLNVPRSPQGHPVLVQAGSSEDGKDFGATYAGAIFTAQQVMEDSRAFSRDIKSRAAAKGRGTDALRILPGFSPIIGSTEAEARRLEDELQELTLVEHGLRHLSTRLGGADLSGLSLDEQLPEEFLDGDRILEGHQSRFALVSNMARTEKLTVRQMLRRLAGGRGHLVFTGAPGQVADEMERWFTAGACDGFNIMPPYIPAGLADFVDHVVPVLQRRGLFRTEYEGLTLREHYGLPRPASSYAVDERSAI